MKALERSGAAKDIRKEIAAELVRRGFSERVAEDAVDARIFGV